MANKKKKTKPKSLFIVRKYIWAKDAKSALALDAKTPPQDVWIDDEWKRMSNQPKDAIGFYVQNDD